MSTNVYNLDQPPPYLLMPHGQPLPRLAEGHAWWSGRQHPPKVGERVKINFNGFGAGEVRGYFVEAGYLGVYVHLDQQPEWHLRQNGCRPRVMVFGAELTAGGEVKS